ncbi:MAG: hypothetical protein KAI67_01225 [Candidatus Pacebacteria bacterium]|nr:hypothetical protein [Candidatus Paceibacterota bacterium]
MKELKENIIGFVVIILFFFLVSCFITPYNPTPQENLGTFDNYNGSY